MIRDTQPRDADALLTMLVRRGPFDERSRRVGTTTMLLARLLLVTCLASSAACSHHASEPAMAPLPPQPIRHEQAEDAIYAWLVDQFANDLGIPVVVTNRTLEPDGMLEHSRGGQPPEEARPSHPDFEQAWAEAWADFQQVRTHQRTIVSIESPRVRYILASRLGIASSFLWCSDPDRWTCFRRQYDNADSIIGFSRVGLSSDGRHAVVYYSRTCAGLCGEWNYRLFRNEGGQWRQVRRIPGITS